MAILWAIPCAFACAVVARYYLHMLQLESYQLDGYARWLARNPDKRCIQPGLIGLGAALLWHLPPLVGAPAWVAHLTSVLALLALAALYDLRLHRKQEKKPLVYTARMKRLYGAAMAVCLLLALALALVGLAPSLLFAASAYLVVLAARAMAPWEKRVNERFLREAREKLAARTDLIKIGITGSYGKTSAKFILHAILSEKFRVLPTPASFNTPLGVTRVVREQLADAHEVFIAEMGARHAGDIRELAELVRPRYGILTSVGAQHLETFGDIETVARVKYELMEALPADGLGVFAADGARVDALYARHAGRKLRAGLAEMGAPEIRAEQLRVGAQGSSFLLVDARGGESVPCETKLLGKHNIQNIVLCCALARELGMSMAQIAAGVAKAQPVEHRLQLLPGAGGITVIDDAFNANPAGARAALEVLAMFPGRHVVVTPGMVEQGAQEAELNREFGAQLAACCELAILVGHKRAQPIAEGLRAAGMPEAGIVIVKDLDEATKVLAAQGRPGDVVLFENDLPDNYAEG